MSSFEQREEKSVAPWHAMRFSEVLRLVIGQLALEGRVTYRSIKREFGVDDAYLDDLKHELTVARRLAADRDGEWLVWAGDPAATTTPEGRDSAPAHRSAVPPRVLTRPPASAPSATRSAEIVPLPVQQPSADAERRQLTVLFCDLVGSTALSTRLDPEDLREVIRAYQGACAKVIAEYDGFIAKFMGDGVLVYFGYPQAHEDDAARAALTGLGIVEAMANIGQALGPEMDIELAVRVGIDTGLVVVGDIVGEGAAEEATVVGETPNVAARLQALARPNQVVIGPLTRELIGGAVACEDLGDHQLKGIAEPVHAWVVTGLSEAESDLEADAMAGGMPLVGRDEEIGLLLRRWEQSKEGLGQAVLISGEPGIGKSALVETVSARVRNQGFARAAFRCSPYHTNSALYPVIEHVKRRLGWQLGEPAASRLEKLEAVLADTGLVVEEAVPLFADMLSLEVPEDRYPPLNLAPQLRKQQLLDALVAWVLDDAERRPLLTVWEDLHWADPTTMEALGLLMNQAPTASLLLALTFRPDFAPPWPTRSHMTPITLNRLERPQIESIVVHLARQKQLPDEVIEHIVAKTDGVPLYVEELTKMILEGGLLKEEDDRYVLTGPLTAVAIPATLQDSLMARLDRLPAVREVAQLGAVLGREFAYEMVSGLAAIEETVLLDGLGQLVDAELLYQRGRPPRAKYIFKHALVQDAAYQSLLKRTRQQYHQQVAELLENRFPEIVQTQPELVAHHYTEAGSAEPAVEHWFRAGQQALQRSANLEAVEHLRKALEVLRTLAESPGRDRRELSLQTTLGPALMATQGYSAPEVGETYVRARQLCEHVGETTELFAVLFGVWLYHLGRGEHQTAHGFAEKLLGLAESLSEPEYLIEARVTIGVSSYYIGELRTANQHFQEGIRLYDPEQHAALALSYGGLDPGVVCLSYGAWTLWLLGEVDQAKASADRAQALSRRLNNAYTLARSHYYDALLRQFVGDWQAVRARAEEAIELATEQGIALVRAVGTIMLGWVQVNEGQKAEGSRQIHQGVDAYRATGASFQLPHFLVPLAEAESALGRPADGLNVLAEAMALAESTGERYFQPELHRLKGELLLAQSAGNQEPAESAFQQALALARAEQAKSLELRAATSLARLWQAQAKMTDAHDLLAPVYQSFSEGFDTPDLKEAKALLDELG